MKNNDWIIARINNYFKYNHIPKFVKHRSTAVLADTDDLKRECGMTFIPMKKTNAEIIENFKKNHYNIIAGTDEYLKRVSPLEVFFIHRTDLIIAFDSDDLVLQNIYRSAFNSPVASLYTKGEDVYFAIDKKMKYRVIDKSKLIKYEGYENLYIPKNRDHSLFLIIDSKSDAKYFEITGLPLFSREKMFDFQTKCDSKVAISKDVISNNLNNNIKGALNFEVSAEFGKLHIQAIQYDKDNARVKGDIEIFINRLIKSMNLKVEEIEVKLNSIW